MGGMKMRGGPRPPMRGGGVPAKLPPPPVMPGAGQSLASPVPRNAMPMPAPQAPNLYAHLGHFARPEVLAAGHNTILSTAQRKRLPASSFAVPSKAPGPGSYPVPDAAHARNALARAAQFGSPKVQAAVKRKVASRFPGIGKGR